jgi:hypothetical protein
VLASEQGRVKPPDAAPHDDVIVTVHNNTFV